MTTKRSIPLFKPVHLPEMPAVASSVLASGQIASGPFVERFTRELGELTAQRHVVLTSDMSSALVIALRLAGVKPEDEVLASPFACMSTNAPIATAGARPRWVDVDPERGTMSPEALARAFTKRTRAVILYHLSGYPADARAIAAVCRERGVPLIEDCDNALGATLDGQPVGSFGDFAIYSFYPNRQINGLEGGAIGCASPDAAARALRLRRLGLDLKTFRDASGEINPLSDVPEVGWAAAMSNLNCAIASAQVASVHERLAQTRRVAARLERGLGSLPRVRPVAPIPGAVPAYWTFLVRSADSTRTLAHLKQNGFGASRLHFRNDTYSGFGVPAEDLPGVTAWASAHVSVPCGWWMDDRDADALVDVLASV